MLCGRFFRVRDTTPLSARSEPTRLRNCQPTCARERGQRIELSSSAYCNNTIVFISSLWFEFCPRRDWISLVEPSVQRQVGVEVVSLSIELSCDVTCPQFENKCILAYISPFLATVFTKPCQLSLCVGLYEENLSRKIKVATIKVSRSFSCCSRLSLSLTFLFICAFSREILSN